MNWFLFVDWTQFIVLPAVGFTIDRKILCLTVAWLFFGFSVELGRAGRRK